MYDLWKKGQGTPEDSNRHPLLDAGGTIVTKDEEKAEVLNAAFASVLNSKASFSQGTQPPEGEDRDKEQNEAPIIQGEMLSDLLRHLDTHKSTGPDGIPPLDPISGSSFWIPPLDPACASHLWTPLLDPSSGSFFGIPPLEPPCASHLWIPPLDPPSGSHPWILL